jgi:hypothetical protein
VKVDVGVADKRLDAAEKFGILAVLFEFLVDKREEGRIWVIFEDCGHDHENWIDMGDMLIIQIISLVLESLEILPIIHISLLGRQHCSHYLSQTKPLKLLLPFPLHCSRKGSFCLNDIQIEEEIDDPIIGRENHLPFLRRDGNFILIGIEIKFYLIHH